MAIYISTYVMKRVEDLTPSTSTNCVPCASWPNGCSIYLLYFCSIRIFAPRHVLSALMFLSRNFGFHRLPYTHFIITPRDTNHGFKLLRNNELQTETQIPFCVNVASAEEDPPRPPTDLMLVKTREIMRIHFLTSFSILVMDMPCFHE